MQDLVEIKDAVDVKTYNDKLIDHSLPDGHCVLALNCFLDDNQIKQRTGYSMIANDTGENKPNLGFLAYEVATGKQLLKINDNAGSTAANLFYWNGIGNWVMVAAPTFTAGVVCSMVVANGKVYISNGVDATKEWDMGTLTLTNMAGIPVTPYLDWFHNYLVALKNSRMYISDLGDPTTFPVGSYIDINPDDGDFITGSNSLKDELMVFKRSRTYSFQGWTELSFTVTFVNEKLASYGTTSDDSIVNTGKDLFFMSFGGGIPHIRSLTETQLANTIYAGIITDSQEGTMKTLSLSQLNKCASVFDGRKVWFFMPTGSSTYNDLTLVYDTITTGVTKHTGIYAARAVASTISGEFKIYFADSRNSKVYVFDGSYDDDGNDIEFRYISKRFQPDFKRFMKWKYLYMQYQRESTGNLEVYTSVDDYLPFLLETLDLNPPVGAFTFTFPFEYSTTPQGDARMELPYNVNRNIQLILYKKDQTAPVSVHDYGFMVKQKPLRDAIPFPAA